MTALALLAYALLAVCAVALLVRPIVRRREAERQRRVEAALSEVMRRSGRES